MHDTVSLPAVSLGFDLELACPESDHFFYFKLPGGEHTCRTGYWMPQALPGRYTGYKPGFTLQYILQGQGSYEDETGERFRLHPGVALFRQGALKHTVTRGATGPWREFYLEVSQQFYSSLREIGIIDPMVRCHYRQLTEDVVVMLNAFIERARQLTLKDQILFLAKIHQLFLDFAPDKPVQVEEDAHLQEKLTQARELLADPAQREHGIPEIARMVGLGYHHFRKMFVRSVGISPNEYRIRAVILRAQGMCLHRCWTFSEISERLGYPDAATFSKQFKRVTGYTPRDFRERKFLKKH